MWFVAKCCEDVLQAATKVVDVVGDDIRQVDALRMVPNKLHRIEVGCVRRQPFHLKPGRPRFENLANGRSVCLESIANDDDRAPQMRVNRTKELDKVASMCVVVEQREVEPKPFRPRRPRDGGDRRDAVAPIPSVLNGSSPSRRPHMLSQRLQHIAAFIEENHASLPIEALFLSAANRRGASE
jgi:hypothetical protein